MADYTIYRNKSIPAWWEEYLPDENNPYTNTDTLTLRKGCLAEYWHFHSSNKHYNGTGSSAQDEVHEMIHERFGGAFLTVSDRWLFMAGHQGQILYSEPEHLVYKNAYLSDKEIHIINARKYYEDVIKFVMEVLQWTSSNHMPSPGYRGEARRYFFPEHTDVQIIQQEEERKQRAERTEALREKLTAYVNSDDFIINTLTYSDVSFSAVYDYNDGWFNVGFEFTDFSTNMEDTVVCGYVSYNSGAHFCLYLKKKHDDTDEVIVPIPASKIITEVINIISGACNSAVHSYNINHKDLHNFFSDHKILQLQLVYTEMEYRWYHLWSKRPFSYTR